MKDRIKKYLGSSFLRNSAVLTSATTIGQVITIFTAPVLTRIYPPTSYDILGVFMMVTGLVGAFSTLQYHNVVVTSKDDDEAVDAISLCLLFSASLSVLVFLILFVFNGFIQEFFKSDTVKNWLLLSPISIFAGGATTAFSSWAIRKSRFNALSLTRILGAVIVPVCSISVGLILKGPFGLLLGLIVSQLFPAIFFWLKFVGKGEIVLNFSKERLMNVFANHSNYAKFSLPAEFINNLINQLPVIFFAKTFGLVGVIGSFNLSNRLLGMPIQLISASVSEVFRQKASSEYNSVGKCDSIFRKTFKVLFALAILPTILIVIFSPWVFGFVFGKEWQEAGVFAQILAPMYFFRFVVSPLTYVFFVARKQKQDFYGHIIMLALVVLAFLLSTSFSENYLVALFSYSITYCLIYLGYLYYSYKYSKGENII